MDIVINNLIKSINKHIDANILYVYLKDGAKQLVLKVPISDNPIYRLISIERIAYEIKDEMDKRPDLQITFKVDDNIKLLIDIPPSFN